MRDYEMTVVLQSDLDQKMREELATRVVGMIPLPAGDDVPEPVVNHWGRRKLAYPINKQSEGYYLYIETQMNSEGISEMERNMSYIEEILRHLVVRKEG